MKPKVKAGIIYFTAVDLLTLVFLLILLLPFLPDPVDIRQVGFIRIRSCKRLPTLTRDRLFVLFLVVHVEPLLVEKTIPTDRTENLVLIVSCNLVSCFLVGTWFPSFLQVRNRNFRIIGADFQKLVVDQGLFVSELSLAVGALVVDVLMEGLDVQATTGLGSEHPVTVGPAAFQILGSIWDPPVVFLMAIELQSGNAPSANFTEDCLLDFGWLVPPRRLVGFRWYLLFAPGF